MTGAWMELVFRWGHFISGITWIGLLYYFNLVQMPFFKEASAEAKAEAFKGLAPRALFWFRWSALATWLFGAALLGSNFVPAFTLQDSMALIGIGAWLATIMLLNVWGLIWPNQKKVLGIVAATPEEKAKAGRVAMLASRTNVMLSIPMLFFMAASTHGQFILG